MTAQGVRAKSGALPTPSSLGHYQRQRPTNPGSESGGECVGLMLCYPVGCCSFLSKTALEARDERFCYFRSWTTLFSISWCRTTTKYKAYLNQLIILTLITRLCVINAINRSLFDWGEPRLFFLSWEDLGGGASEVGNSWRSLIGSAKARLTGELRDLKECKISLFS